MGLFGKGVTWPALHSMGVSQGEYQPLSPNKQNQQTHKKGIIWYINPIVIMIAIKKKWQRQETQDTKKK
uniref:S2 protein n=1 Tax=Equine infectious anemia virus TaxID=11665 RepID=J3T2Z3_9RETR|nr:S2 protein [Equine infectious anemia virus]